MSNLNVYSLFTSMALTFILTLLPNPTSPKPNLANVRECPKACISQGYFVAYTHVPKECYGRATLCKRVRLGIGQVNQISKLD